VDVDSFSDAALEVRKETVPAAAVESCIAADVAAPSESPTAAKAPAAEAPAAGQASSEFTKELELTIQSGENPTEHAPLIEVREIVPEDQAPSPSLAAFNKSFGTSHRGKLLRVGFETTGVGSKASKFLTLWKSSAIVDETGGEASNDPNELLRTPRKGLTLPPKPLLRLARKLLLVRLNKSPCSTSVSKVRSFLLLFHVFSDY
jgi:hypothetical protein